MVCNACCALLVCATCLVLMCTSLVVCSGCSGVTVLVCRLACVVSVASLCYCVL